MRASDFEYRYQTLLHLLVVGAAFLTYAFQPDDIVWAFIKHHTTYRTLLERSVFGVGTLMILCSAAYQTWGRVRGFFGADERHLTVGSSHPFIQHPLYYGRLLFALGIGLLAPIAGTAILLAGEVVLVVRLLVRERDVEGASSLSEVQLQFPARGDRPNSRSNWNNAFRKEASKWGLAVTMVVFTLTLRDRVAEILAGASFLLWFALNLSEVLRSPTKNQKALQ